MLAGKNNNTIGKKTAMADNGRSRSCDAKHKIRNSGYIRESNRNIQIDVVKKSGNFSEV
jgi:hypothetical protein